MRTHAANATKRKKLFCTPRVTQILLNRWGVSQDCIDMTAQWTGCSEAARAKLYQQAGILGVEGDRPVERL